MITRLFLLAALLLSIFTNANAIEQQWQNNELHYQRGYLKAPTFAGGTENDTHVLTLQHASGWSFGDIFFFADWLNDRNNDTFNDNDLYSELYLSFSLGKLSDTEFTAGPIKDVGLLVGFNYSRDARVRKWLPGFRLSWDLPGFAFFNTDLTLYLDDSAGISGGGAATEDDSFMLDINWAYPFTLGGQRFSIEGHGEYIGERRNAYGQTVSDWILLQPQLRYDLGHGLGYTRDRFFIGIEWQYWRHKLGDRLTRENVPQALLVWRL